MSSSNSLSIIIPVKNRAELVVKTLDSILAQDTPPTQVVVVDNNSNDGSLRSIEHWAQQNSPLPFEFVTSSEHTPGACAARNRGAELASENILLFFDSDDTMRPQLVSRILSNFSSPEIKIVYWKKMLHGLDNSSKILKWSKNLTLDMQVYHCPLNTICYAVRRDFFVQSGKWNEQLPCWNDWEFGLRLLIQSNEKSLLSINEVLVDGFIVKQSITGIGSLHNAGKWEKAIEKAKQHSSMLPQKNRKHFLRSLCLKEAVLAGHYWKEGGTVEANETMNRLMNENANNTITKIVLNCAYLYTRAGLRGAFTIFGKLV